MKFQDEYRSLFAKLGFPLSAKDGIPTAQLTKAENKLGVSLPHALRDYYLVAGKEKVLNHSFNRLCPPNDWEIHSGKLIFFEENQTVVVWGVPVLDKISHDPMIYQCPMADGELGKWYSEQSRCSDFLKFMIHLQAAYGGGMPMTGSASVPDDLSKRLNNNWHFAGEVNGMRAYAIQACAICITQWQGFGSSKKTWRVFGGAKNQDALNAVAAELHISWEI